jgi:archaellum component FlaC
VDQAKGDKLEEISAIVTQINDKIRTKKNVLAPKIKDLREKRGALDELLLTHGEAQQGYDRAVDGQSAQTKDLEAAVGELRTKVEQVRSCLKYLFV